MTNDRNKKLIKLAEIAGFEHIDPPFDSDYIYVSGRTCQHLWNPYEDIDHAFECLKATGRKWRIGSRDAGWRFVLNIPILQYTYSCSLQYTLEDGSKYYVTDSGPTVQEAICVAVLACEDLGK